MYPDASPWKPGKPHSYQVLPLDQNALDICIPKVTHYIVLISTSIPTQHPNLVRSLSCLWSLSSRPRLRGGPAYPHNVFYGTSTLLSQLTGVCISSCYTYVHTLHLMSETLPKPDFCYLTLIVMDNMPCGCRFSENGPTSAHPTQLVDDGLLGTEYCLPPEVERNGSTRPHPGLTSHSR